MNQDRRQFIKATAAGAAGLATLRARSAFSKHPQPRPNVLLIIVDQMRKPRWFPERAHLPALERLKSEGVSFENHFTSAVPCSPSRASLLTGLHVPQHGVKINMAMPGGPGNESLDPKLTTIGHIFQKAGYRTPYFGKWHLSVHHDYQKDGLSRYGFEDWKGPDRDGWPLEGLQRDAKFADQAINWIENNNDSRPWFLTCSLINPHDIMHYRRLALPAPMVPDICSELPGNFNDSLEGKPSVQADWQKNWGRYVGVRPGKPERLWREYLDFYYYLNRKADQQIMRVLDALERSGQSDNTLVVFTSDHGEMAGSHMLQGKGPFPYQENNQVPLVMRWPGHIEPGLKTDALTQSVDFIHTLSELAQVPATLDHLPGQSLVPIIKDSSSSGVNEHVLTCWDYSNTLQLGLIGHVLGLSTISAPLGMRTIFDGRYKFSRYFDVGMDEEFEMYDLMNDPLEMTNLSADPGYRGIHREMSDMLLEAEQGIADGTRRNL